MWLGECADRTFELVKRYPEGDESHDGSKIVSRAADGVGGGPAEREGGARLVADVAARRDGDERGVRAEAQLGAAGERGAERDEHVVHEDRVARRARRAGCRPSARRARAR